MTMEEVASAAGVSAATVSHAYRRPEKLSAAQRRRIFDPTLQRPLIEAAAATNPGALIVLPTDTSALQRPLGHAKEKGTKIILFDTTTKDPSVAGSRIATDNPGVGSAAFEAIAQEHPDGGKVWVIGAAPDISISDDRVKGSEDAVKKDPKSSFAGVEFGRDDTARSALLGAAALQKAPDVVGIFAASTKGGSGRRDRGRASAAHRSSYHGGHRR